MVIDVAPRWDMRLRNLATLALSSAAVKAKDAERPLVLLGKGLLWCDRRIYMPRRGDGKRGGTLGTEIRN